MDIKVGDVFYVKDDKWIEAPSWIRVFKVTALKDTESVICSGYSRARGLTNEPWLIIYLLNSCIKLTDMSKLERIIYGVPDAI